MKFTALIFAMLTANFASAAELSYQIDLEKSKMDEITAFDICGLPKELKLNVREDLATVVINKTQGWGAGGLAIQTIQASEGSMMGGDLQEPYQGDYRIRVSIVKIPAQGYSLGVYKRVEVVTYGPTSAPKAFTVEADLLNHRESAELAEDSVCTGFAYRLQ